MNKIDVEVPVSCAAGDSRIQRRPAERLPVKRGCIPAVIEGFVPESPMPLAMHGRLFEAGLLRGTGSRSILLPNIQKVTRVGVALRAIAAGSAGSRFAALVSSGAHDTR